MKNISFIFVILFLVSCNTKKEEKVETSEVNSIEDFDLYTPSEMSLHMNDMFEFNEEIKKKIIAGEPLENFPENFLKIHSAKLSEAKDRNETFEAYSKTFIESEKEIFNSASTIPLKDRYNNAINTCVMCHKTECVGPIPRIKKLLIN